MSLAGRLSPLLLLPLAAALLRVGAQPGWWLPELALVVVALRVWYWEKDGGRWGEYFGGVLFYSLAFYFLGAAAAWAWLPPLAVGLFLGLWALVERGLYRGLRRWLPCSLGGALALVAVGHLRFAFPMGGVPWASLGLAFGDRPVSLKWASVLGESGLSLLVALWGGFLIALFVRRRWWELLPAPLLTLVAMVAAAAPPAVVGGIKSVAIQGNLTLAQKHGEEGAERPRYRMRQVFDLQTQPTLEALIRVPDAQLLLWAETMFPYPVMPVDQPGWLRRPWPGRADEEVEAVRVSRLWKSAVAAILEFAPLDCRFVTGAHFYEPVASRIGPEYSPRSSEFMAFAWSGGEVTLVDHFTKQQLVPFGERLPLNGHFPGADSLAMVIFRMTRLFPRFAASDRQGPLQLGDATLGGAVCWENVYEKPFRQQAEDGAQAFLVLSNEAWYGISAEMEQMVTATRLRARESGRAVLRATNTGITVLVDGGGHPVASMDPGVAGFLAVDLPLIEGGERTPYMVWGWALRPLCAWLATLIGLLGLLLRPRPQGPEAGSAVLDPSPGRK